MQGVLQMDGVGIRHQFVEYLRTVGELFVVFAVLVQESDGSIIASFGIAITVALPVYIAQMQQQNTFLYSVAA